MSVDCLEVESDALRVKNGLYLLTGRERDVLTHSMNGASSEEIGRILGISPRTVEAHRHSILVKTGAKNLRRLVGVLAPLIDTPFVKAIQQSEVGTRATSAPHTFEPHHRFATLGKSRSRAMAESALPADDSLLHQLLSPFLGRPDVDAAVSSLLTRFGSLAGVLGAPGARLIETPGLGPRSVTMLKAVQSAAQRLTKDRLTQAGPLLSSWSALIDYCHNAMAYEVIEQLRIFFLDKRNYLIADEIHQTGTVDFCPVYPREVIKRSFELSATAIILVHNHPSGDPSPSPADVKMTRLIKEIAEPLGIAVQDHVIIGRSGHISLREQHLI